MVPWIRVSISKSQVIWGKPKKTVFCNFWCNTQNNFQVAANRTLSKIDALHIAHCTARRSCSKFFKTHAENSDTFNNMGVRPPQSQLIRICVTLKSCFLITFFSENLSFDPFRHHLRPPMIYIVGKLWISRFMSSSPHPPELNLYAVRFFVTLRESFHYRTSHSVVLCFVQNAASNWVKFTFTF